MLPELGSVYTSRLSPVQQRPTRKAHSYMTDPCSVSAPGFVCACWTSSQTTANTGDPEQGDPLSPRPSRTLHRDSMRARNRISIELSLHRESGRNADGSW